MSTQILQFNGTDLTQYGIETWQESANTRLNAVTVPNRHGALISSAVVQDARQITLTGRVITNDGTQLGLRTQLSNLSALLAVQNAKLQLWDDLYINAYKANFTFAYTPGSALLAADFTVTFLCVDPFYYSTSTDSNAYNLTTSDVVLDITNNIYQKSITLNYPGSFLIYPVWTISAGATPLSKITVRNLTIGRQFVWAGALAANTALIVDTTQFTVTNNGTNDLTHWNGDFVWLVPGNNSLQFEGTTPSTYLVTSPIRNY